MIFMNGIKNKTLLDALWKKHAILINVIETITQGQFASIYEASYTAMRLNEMQFFSSELSWRKGAHIFWINILFYLLLKLFNFHPRTYYV